MAYPGFGLVIALERRGSLESGKQERKMVVYSLAGYKHARDSRNTLHLCFQQDEERAQVLICFKKAIGIGGGQHPPLLLFLFAIHGNHASRYIGSHISCYIACHSIQPCSPNPVCYSAE